MKKVVTQMIGCLNVLSRLKNPGIRISSAADKMNPLQKVGHSGPLYVEQAQVKGKRRTSLLWGFHRHHFRCWSLLNSSDDFFGMPAGGTVTAGRILNVLNVIRTLSNHLVR
jgi:hypothetical protein